MVPCDVMQPAEDSAMVFTGETSGGQILADRSERGRVVEGGRGFTFVGRGAGGYLTCRIAVCARRGPGRVRMSHAISAAGGRGDRAAHKCDLHPTERPCFSHRACNNLTSMLSSPMRQLALWSRSCAGSSASRICRSWARHFSNCSICTPVLPPEHIECGAAQQPQNDFSFPFHSPAQWRRLRSGELSCAFRFNVIGHVVDWLLV